MSTPQTCPATQANVMLDRLYGEKKQLTTFLIRSKHTSKEDAALTKFVEVVQDLRALRNYKTIYKTATRQHHCVRCHESFSDVTNGPAACSIPHTFYQDDGDEMRLPHESKNGGFEEYKTVWTARCCGEEVEASGEDQPEDLEESCFEGQHTTDARRVTRNGVNIIPCVLQGGKCVAEVDFGDLF